MSTGFSIPTVITKRTKALNTGSVTNDVIYTCPANCVTDVYLSDVSHGNPSGFFALQSINLVRAGGPVQNVVQINGSQNVIGNGNIPLNLGGQGFVKNNTNANANAVVGTETDDQNSSSSTGNATKFGSVIRLFPNDYLVANYNGVSSGATLVYSTIEVFGQ